MIGTRRWLHRVRPALAAVGLLAAASLAHAQGLYYKEIKKDDRIYVFNIAANADRFEKSGEMGVGITKPGVGPNGETVVGDNERALQLFFFKHGISEVVPDPPAPPDPNSAVLPPDPPAPPAPPIPASPDAPACEAAPTPPAVPALPVPAPAAAARPAAVQLPACWVASVSSSSRQVAKCLIWSPSGEAAAGWPVAPAAMIDAASPSGSRCC